MAANIRRNLMRLSKDSHTSSEKKAGDGGGRGLANAELMSYRGCLSSLLIPGIAVVPGEPETELPRLVPPAALFFTLAMYFQILTYLSSLIVWRKHQHRGRKNTHRIRI